MITQSQLEALRPPGGARLPEGGMSQSELDALRPVQTPTKREFALPPASPIALESLPEAAKAVEGFGTGFVEGATGLSWPGRAVAAARGVKPPAWADVSERPGQFAGQVLGTIAGDLGPVFGVEAAIGRAAAPVGQGIAGLLKYGAKEGGKRALAYGGLEAAVEGDEIAAGTRQSLSPLEIGLTAGGGALSEVFPMLKMWSMRNAVPAGPGAVGPGPAVGPSSRIAAPQAVTPPNKRLQWNPPELRQTDIPDDELLKGQTRKWLQTATPEDINALTPEAHVRLAQRFTDEEVAQLSRFLGRSLTQEEVEGVKDLVVNSIIRQANPAMDKPSVIPMGQGSAVPAKAASVDDELKAQYAEIEARELRDFPAPVIADIAGEIPLSADYLEGGRTFLLTTPNTPEAKAIRHIAADIVGQEGEVSGLVAILPSGEMIKSPRVQGLTGAVTADMREWLQWVKETHPDAGIVDLHSHPAFVYQSGYAAPGLKADQKGDAAYNLYMRDLTSEMGLDYIGSASVTRRFYDFVAPDGRRLIAAHGLNVAPKSGQTSYEMGRVAPVNIPKGTQGVMLLDEAGQPLSIVGLRQLSAVQTLTKHAHDLERTIALHPEAHAIVPISNLSPGANAAWQHALTQRFGDLVQPLNSTLAKTEVPVIAHHFAGVDSAAEFNLTPWQDIATARSQQGPGYALTSGGSLQAWVPTPVDATELLRQVAASKAFNVIPVDVGLPPGAADALHQMEVTTYKPVSGWDVRDRAEANPQSRFTPAGRTEATLPTRMSLADLSPSQVAKLTVPTKHAPAEPPQGREAYTSGLGALSSLMTKPLRDFGNWALTPISDRLYAISPTLGFRLAVRYESDLLTSIHDSLMQIVPFQDAWKRLSPEQRRIYSLRLYNDLGIPDNAPPDMQAAWGQIQDLMASFAIKLKIPTDSNYFPRMLRSYADLQKVLTPDAASRLNLSDFIFREQAEGEIGISIRQLRGLSQRLKSLRPNDFAPGFLQGRKIDSITDALLPFYMDPVQAVATYARLAATLAERHNFFGPFAVQQDGRLMLTDSIEKFAADAAAKGELTPENLPEVKRILSARFGPGEQAMNRLLTSVKDLWLLELLAQWKSAITQFGDIGPVIIRDGFIPTLSAVLSPEKKAMARALGLDKRYGVELETKNPTLTSRLLQKGLEWSGFAWVDMSLKGVNIISSGKKWQKMLKTSKGTERFLEQWMPFFDEETLLPIMAALDAGDFHHPGVRYLLFSDLRRTQPISRSEMPQAYLEMRNGRTFYTLKSYAIKQVAFMRQEAIAAEKALLKQGSGPVRAKAAATQKLLYSLAVLGFMGASVAELQDFLFNGKDDGTFLDKVVANMLKLFTLSPWALNQISKAGEKSPTKGDALAAKAKAVGKVVTNTVTPPVGALLYPLQEESRLKAVPIVGGALHGWTRDDESGGGGPFIPKGSSK